MTTLRQPEYHMTEADYLTFEQTSDIRHEFVAGEIYAMTGASNNHIVIVGNLQTTLNNQLSESPCLVMSSDLRVKVKHRKSYRYPDLTVVCDKPEMVGDDNPQSLQNPIILVEVLSPSTASIDHIQKFEEYTQIESLQEYLIIAQDEAKIKRFLRQDDNQWLYGSVVGLSAALELPSIACTLNLADVYRKVTFPDVDEI